MCTETLNRKSVHTFGIMSLEKKLYLLYFTSMGISFVTAALLPPKAELVVSLINEQLSFVEQAILLAGDFTVQNSYLKDDENVSHNSNIKRKKAMLMRKVYSQLGNQLNYFLFRTNEIKRSLIGLLFPKLIGEKPPNHLELKDDSLKLAGELKYFLSHDLRNFYYETGKEMDFSVQELDKNWVAVLEILKRMGIKDLPK